MKIKTKKPMKNRVNNTAALLIPALFLLATTLSGQPATKEFHKEYTAGPNTTLDINNRYGDVKVETNNQNQVTIDVKVTVELPNRERAEKLLSYIDVQFAQNDNTISAKTEIDKAFNFSGWGGGSRRFSIDYTVKMPENINFTLVNRYGNSELGPVKGLVKCDIRYGNITAENLTRGEEKPWNYIEIAYGKATIDEAGWLDINARYCGDFEIGKCQAVLLDSKYSKFKIGETSSVVAESKYDNLRIEKINNLVLDAGYSDVNVGMLAKKLKFDGGYGAFSVDEIPAGFESLETDTRYIGVKLGIASDANYQLDAKLSYGDLKFNEENFQNQKRIIQNNTNETSGVVGKESSPSAKVTINATYGTVKLY
jgi:uncharacterized alkaline shock family protein YloU